MKNIINRIIVAGLILSVFSCTDLAEEPVGLLAPEAFFKTASDVETAVMGTYADIASETYYGRKLVLSLQLRSDMCDIGDRNTPARRQQVNDFNMDSNNGMITAFWPKSYRIIGTANAAIAGADLIIDGGSTDPKVLQFKAEATFVRAFAYYHLVRIFGDIPYIDFAITNPDDVKELSKTAEADVYQGIIADLIFAKENLPDTPPAGARSRATAGTAASYLASVYLTIGDDQNAYNEAKFVIDNKDRFGYGLMADFAELYDGYSNDGLAEHVFIIDFAAGLTGTNSQGQDWMAPITGIRSVYLPNTNAGWSVSVPSMDVFDSWDARDYRKNVSFIDSAYADEDLTEKIGYDRFAPNHGSPRPHIGKFYRLAGNHRGDGGYSDNNYPAFRYAEVLLIAAEAADNLGGKDAEALGYVNQIRERARNWNGTQVDFPADATGSDDLTEVIREERRLELAFEYKRWYDIKRWGIGDEVFKGANSLEPHPEFSADRDYYFPLPQDELDRNENLKPQNSGY
jgi:hypothetical protein